MRDWFNPARGLESLETPCTRSVRKTVDYNNNRRIHFAQQMRHINDAHNHSKIKYIIILSGT